MMVLIKKEKYIKKIINKWKLNYLQLTKNEEKMKTLH
jgi:predicted GIY-YIG superfamily endonuclease